MPKLLKQILILFCLVGLLVLPYFVFAEEKDMRKILNAVGEYSGYSSGTNETSMSMIAGTAVKAFLSILGTIFIILIVLAGYNYMTAQGDKEKTDKALATIKHAVIGLIIVIGAYAIWAFVSSYFFSAGTSPYDAYMP